MILVDAASETGARVVGRLCTDQRELGAATSQGPMTSRTDISVLPEMCVAINDLIKKTDTNFYKILLMFWVVYCTWFDLIKLIN